MIFHSQLILEPQCLGFIQQYQEPFQQLLKHCILQERVDHLPKCIDNMASFLIFHFHSMLFELTIRCRHHLVVSFLISYNNHSRYIYILDYLTHRRWCRIFSNFRMFWDLLQGILKFLLKDLYLREFAWVMQFFFLQYEKFYAQFADANW